MEQVEPASCLTSRSLDDMVRLVRHFKEAESSVGPCKLDLSDRAIAGGAPPSAIRLHIPSVMVAVNLLVGRFQNLPVEVQLPRSSGLNLQLARGGLFFALAKRGGRVTWAGGAPEEWERVARTWIQPFHPNDDAMYRDALVDVRDVEREPWIVHAAFQRYLLSVIHPHLRPAYSLRADLDEIAQRWLSTRLDIPQGSELVSTLGDCAAIFYEICVNVPDHAGLGCDSSGVSLGQIYVTLGGGRDSCNRLHMSVADNGVGLVQRVNERYPDRVRYSEEALLDAVLGNLPRREAGRGVGLGFVREIADEYAQGERDVGGPSSIHIITNGDNEHSASEIRWEAGADPSVASVGDLPVQGTLVWVCLGLERRTPDDGFHQVELTFAEPVSR